MTTVDIWNSFEQKLFAFILGKVRDRDLASDLLHDVFEKIHLKIDTLRSEDKLESWLYRITRNTVNDHFRQQKPQYDLDEEHLQVVDEIDKHEELVDCLVPFFKKLPSPYKEVLYDFQFLKIPQKEIASKHGVAHSTIRSQVKRAKKMLHDQFMCCCQEQLVNADLICCTDQDRESCN